MVKVDLNSKKTIVFDTTNTDKIVSANFVVQFTNNVIYTYPGTMDAKANTVTIDIPVLKELISKEIEGSCYLELQDDNERYYRVSKDTISFFYGSVIEVNFHPGEYEVDAKYRDKNEVVIDSKNLKLTPVKYKETEPGQKPLRREAILTLN
jgi:hypothetical protein